MENNLPESNHVNRKSHIFDRFFDFEIKINLEASILILIILVAIVTRFYDLETRVMSHDESLHTYYSWRFKEFQDYQHTPLMHGPTQFHLIAFSYFLFGDSDASARIPFALIGVASVILLYAFRRWLGRWGTILAMALMVVSPYMLYYQRYVRNEAIVVLLGLLMFWFVFEYFENRQSRWLYLLAISLSIHHATKETAFIYTAQLLLFLGVFLAWDLLHRSWGTNYRKWLFIFGLIITILGVSVTGWGLMSSQDGLSLGSPTPETPLDPTAVDLLSGVGALPPVVTVGFFITIFGALILVTVTVLTFGKKLKTDFPALDLLIIVGALTLPLLAAIPARILGFEPFDGQSSVFTSNTGIIVLVFLLISIGVGAAWGWKKWSISVALFFGIFILLFTSLFTNGNGLSSGLVRSLEYWLVQQEVERGGQPFYYYLLVQIPIYEYLPAIGAIIAAAFGIRTFGERVSIWLSTRAPSDPDEDQPVVVDSSPIEFPADPDEDQPDAVDSSPKEFPVMLFLGYWAVSSLIAYSVAGEKMPWLTVHIVLPMILLAGWGVQQLINSSDHSALKRPKSWIAVALLIVFVFSLVGMVGGLLGPETPFKGNDLASLRATSLFIGSTTVTVGALIGLIYLFQDLPLKAFRHLLRFAMLGILFILTARTAFRASYMNADLANEYLVYAHAAPGVKTVLSQIEEFSQRTTGGLSVQVAYDNDVSWPYTWYFRNYTNTHYYAENPTRELLEYPLIIAGNDNWTEVERIIGNRYISSEFIRMWWPNQDYFKMSVASIDAERRSEILLETGDEPAPMSTFEYIRRVLGRITPFFTDPQVRKAVWQIWLNRDFSYYGEINDRDFSLENWSPSDSMRFYVRRDVAEQLWDYGFLAGGVSDVPIGDPYMERIIELQAELIVDSIEAEPTGLLSPRGIATAADGSVYVADSLNHRIVHLSVQGTLLNQWGSFGQMQDGVPAVPGTFSEPWGVAVDPDGNVFVADTWNHRVQKFSANGEFISTIGPSAQDDEQIFWGPRALAFDREGRLFIADTGNHRIAIYDNSGEFLGDFGEQGYDFGQLREPVGIAFDSDNRIYVIDTWNHRVQVFEEIGDNEFFFMKEWTVEGWYGESLDNKPYIAISSDDNICLTDPEGFRVLCFSKEGSYTIGWGDYGATDSRFGLLSGVGFTNDGKIWVSDPGNNRVMLFEPPLP